MDAFRLVAWNHAVDADGAVRHTRDGSRLNAAMIISGSVRLAGAEARITTNLIDTASGCYLWSGSIDRKLENIFARPGGSGARRSQRN